MQVDQAERPVALQARVQLVGNQLTVLSEPADGHLAVIADDHVSVGGADGQEAVQAPGSVAVWVATFQDS